MYPHICTEPTGFIIAVGSDPEAYKGSQISLPPPDKQWYKRNDGGNGEGDDGKDGTYGGAGADDDQSLKTPSPLPPALPSLPRADLHWYKLRDESKGSEATEICSIEGGTEKDLNLYSDKDEGRDPDVSSSEEGLNESCKCNVHPHNTTCKYTHTHIHTNTCALYRSVPGKHPLPGKHPCTQC